MLRIKPEPMKAMAVALAAPINPYMGIRVKFNTTFSIMLQIIIMLWAPGCPACKRTWSVGTKIENNVIPAANVSKTG